MQWEKSYLYTNGHCYIAPVYPKDLWFKVKEKLKLIIFLFKQMLIFLSLLTSTLSRLHRKEQPKILNDPWSKPVTPLLTHANVHVFMFIALSIQAYCTNQSLLWWICDVKAEVVMESGTLNHLVTRLIMNLQRFMV